jgi:hypothetical protein
MDLIESSLGRLYDRVSRFIHPSAALRDVRCLKAQIELRGQVLRDIQVMRCGLRPLKRHQNERCYPKVLSREPVSPRYRTCPPVSLTFAIGFFGQRDYKGLSARGKHISTEVCIRGDCAPIVRKL